MLNSIFDSTSITISSVLISMITAIILGIYIAFIHKKTSNYTKNFLITIAMLPLLVYAVMLMVNGNLGTSVAIMGAFSLVRFRSIPGNSKEILIVFFSMAVGLSCGMGQIYFAIILTIIGSLLLIILNKINIFNINSNEKKLTILVPENLEYDNMFKDIFDKYTNKSDLTKIKTTNMGSMYELTYLINLKDNYNIKEFIDSLRTRNGNLKISLLSTGEENEL